MRGVLTRGGACLLLALLAGCASTGKQEQASNPNAGRYALQNDKAPEAPVDVSKVPDAVPRVEPRSLAGNRSPYEVLGHTYRVLTSAKGYEARGTASWYGSKFHGYRTSNGEVYDMYSMTAAHKTLPLPTYVRVTNLDNGRKVVVRVNDRGPFHDGRIIDLSYAAAARLGMLGKGTARVQLDAIDPSAPAQPVQLAEKDGKAVTTGTVSDVQLADRKPGDNTAQAAPQIPETSSQSSAPGRYLQVGAFADSTAAARIEKRLGPLQPGLGLHVTPVQRDGRTLYRVQVGPVPDSETQQRLMQQLADAGYTQARPVDLP